LIRFVRVFIAAGIAAVISEMSKDPKYSVLVVPVISAIGKFIRDKYNLTWLPF